MDTIIGTVLNLIINGLPSILFEQQFGQTEYDSFKPYYKWITFNTIKRSDLNVIIKRVLNLIINGLPSIQNM